MQQLEKDLTHIYQSLVNKDFIAHKVADDAHSSNRVSTLNLVHYIALRTSDLRNVHDHLSDLGISSLRSCESYVLHNVISALRLVKGLNGKIWEPAEGLESLGYKNSKKLINKRTRQLFSTIKRQPRKTKIMVTLPVEAAYNPEIIGELLANGMEIARINLSHGTIEEWALLVKNVKEQAKEQDLDCQIYMDLSGPKIRTENVHSVDSTGKKMDYLQLKVGHHVILTADLDVVNEYKEESTTGGVHYPKVAVSLPSIIKDVEVADRIFFDDGLLETKVIRKRENEIVLIVLKVHKKNNKFKLKSRKGINLPDTKLILPSLTTADIANMPFVMQHADIVGYSFVKTVEDIKALHRQIDKYGRDDLGVVLKIENQESFENLPVLLI